MSEYNIYSFSSDSDDPTFKDLLEKALSGNLLAQYDLHRMYAFGNSVEKNCDKADYWGGRMREHGIGLSEEEERHIPIL